MVDDYSIGAADLDNATGLFNNCKRWIAGLYCNLIPLNTDNSYHLSDNRLLLIISSILLIVFLFVDLHYNGMFLDFFSIVLNFFFFLFMTLDVFIKLNLVILKGLIFKLFNLIIMCLDTMFLGDRVGDSCDMSNTSFLAET